MKTALKIGMSSLALCLALILGIFAAQVYPNTEEKDKDALSPRLISDESQSASVNAETASSYTIVFSTNDSVQIDANLASDLSSHFVKLGLTVFTRADIVAQTQYEILFGETNRALSAELAADVKAASADENLVWAIAERDGSIAYVANSAEAYTRGFRDFEAFYTDTGLSVPSGTWKVITLSRAERDEELASDKAAVIEALKASIADFTLSDFGDPTIETSMPYNRYGPLTLYPTAGEHPRLGVTPYIIDDIKAFLESEEFRPVATSFWEYANSEYTGILPAAREVTSGRSGFHNVDEAGLMRIEAKALAYLLTGDELYGYQAIFAMKNYLTTLDLRWIYSDQCREFGRTIFCAAEVYDWCYDLLTDADKQQLKLGITDICTGSAAPEDKGKCGSGDRFMEIGFPPSGQGSVSGHGSERQLLRDYFAVAIAIFDEDPSWYDFVGGRIYNEYVPFRNHYYQSGTYPQGINLYAPGRHSADVWSAWFMYTACGEIAYDDTLNNIIKSFYSYELPNGTFFGTGDSGRRSDASGFNACAYVIMALYKDPYLYSWLYHTTTGFTKANASNLEMSYSHILIFMSSYMSDSSATRTPASRYENTPTVSYNGYPIGQIISRYEWENEDAPAVFMKIGERTTANHEHADAGTFQIYYKGLYTGESGLYATYGSTHFTYYHQATVAHNGLLVYNPTKYNGEVNASGEPVAPSSYWYSGGQRDPGESPNLDAWLEDSDYDTGTVTSVDYAFDPDGRADYVYISGDISKAYPVDTVEFVGRSMLAVYTGDESFPLYFLVYDRITSSSPDYEKRFLLQTAVEPVIDDKAKTVTLTEGDGKLVLTSLMGGDKITPLGGKGQTFLINGVNCAANTGSDGKNWGRVEISATTGEKYTELFNAMYVTDATNENALSPELIETEYAVGTRLGDTVLLFARELDPSCETIEFETEGKGLLRHVISGVYAGTWKVAVDGVSVATVVASEGGNVIDFYAPAGTVTVSPGADIPPANGGRIIYNAYGGILPEDAPLTFEIGVPVTLPTSVIRGADIFLGWYTDPSLADEFRVTEFVGTEKGRFTLYASYKAYPLNETYEGVTIKHSESNKTVSGVAYNGSGKTGALFMTETGSDGNTYLKIVKGSSDPALNFAKDIPSYIGKETKVTVTLNLAKLADTPMFASNCRLRATSSKDTVSIFTTAVDGTVKLNGKTVIATVGESFEKISITVDFASGTMTAYERYGEVIATANFAPPAASGKETTLEWMSTLTATFNWYMSGGADGTALVDNLTVSTGAYEPEVEIVPDGMEKVIYNMGGKPVPSDAPAYYTVGAETPLPTPEADGDVFLGWYSSPDFEESAKIEAIPATATGEYSVYARWLGIFLEEDFEDVDDFNYTESKGSMGAISLSASTNKVGANAKSETDTGGNKYLVFTRGENDPHLAAEGGVGNFGGASKALTVQVSLATVDGKEPLHAQYRIRRKLSGKNTDLIMFSTTTSGQVLLGGNADAVIAELGSDFTDIAVTVSWDTGMLTGFKDGVKVCETAFNTQTYNLDWLAAVTSCLNFYAKGGEALKIDNFFSYTDLHPAYYTEIPEKGNKIDYVLGGGTLPSDAPLYFSTTEDTVLPTPTKSPDTFLGWYTTSTFDDGTEISAIPMGEAASFTVYARWSGIFINENFNDVADTELTETKGSIGSVFVNAKTGSVFKTDTDADGNRFVIFIKGENDPHLSISGSVGAFASTDKAFTAEVSLALVDGMTPMCAQYRTRAKIDGKNYDLILFSTTVDGQVLLGDNASALIADLSTDFTDIAVTVNWDTGMLTGFKNGEKVCETAFNTETYSLDWLSKTTARLYFYANANGGEALKIDNLYSYTDIHPSEAALQKKCNIIYETDGGTLPADAPTSLSPTEDTPLPTPTKGDDVFLGWYTTEAFEEESRITVIPATDAESFTVYAKWLGIYISESFDDAADVELNAKNGTVGTIGVTANNKTGTAIKTETDADENKYLVFSIENSEAVDPHLYYTDTPITDFAGARNALTVHASLATVEGIPALSASYRIRARIDSSKLDLFLFTVTTDGAVYLGTSDSGVKLADLTSSEFTDIAVTADWDNGKLYGYTGGEYVGEIALDTENRGLEWLASATNLMYFYAKTASGALKIDDLYAYTREHCAYVYEK